MNSPSSGFKLPDRSDVSGVILDIGGVLSLPDVAPLISEMAPNVQVSSDPDVLEEAHYQGVRAMYERHGETQFDSDDSSNWRAYDFAYAQTVSDDPITLSRAVSEAFRRGGVWTRCRSEALNAVQLLREARLPMSVVSNNNGSASQQLVDLGYGRRGSHYPMFDIVIDSHLVGIAKPDPRIFRLGCEPLGLDPSRVVYVGDTATVDVPGANAAGMIPVQLDPFDLHSDLPHFRCSSLTQLAEHLVGAP